MLVKRDFNCWAYHFPKAPAARNIAARVASSAKTRFIWESTPFRWDFPRSAKQRNQSAPLGFFSSTQPRSPMRFSIPARQGPTSVVPYYRPSCSISKRSGFLTAWIFGPLRQPQRKTPANGTQPLQGTSENPIHWLEPCQRCMG